jgi:hypothetical protein
MAGDKTAIGYEQERDRTAIYEANVRTRAQQSTRAAAGTANTRVRPGQTDADAATRSISTSQGRLPHEDRKADRSDSNEIKGSRQDRYHLALQIKSIVSQAESISKANNQMGSRWIIRIYLIAILSGLCSALIIMLIIWTEIR